MRLHVHIFILILVCWQLTACTENAQQENQSATSNRSDSKQFATISIDDKQYTLPHVICQPPHPQTKAYTVMASEIEGDVVEGASFRSFGTPSY